MNTSQEFTTREERTWKPRRCCPGAPPRSITRPVMMRIVMRVTVKLPKPVSVVRLFPHKSRTAGGACIRVLDIQDSILTLDDRKDEFRLSEPPHTEDVDRACADTDGSRVRSLVIRLTTTTPSGSASLGHSKHELMATLRTLESQKVRRRPAAVISTGTEIALV